MKDLSALDLDISNGRSIINVFCLGRKDYLCPRDFRFDEDRLRKHGLGHEA